MKKILLLTDSRGAHKPAGSTHKIYAERLAKTPGVKLASYRCPYQWTTIPDLLQILKKEGAENYDHVILHAGIVGHSPRGYRSMMENLIDPIAPMSREDEEALLASRDFSRKKIQNSKRPLLEEIFGKESVDSHFSKPFSQKYEGDKTINLYSIEMLKERLVPLLQQIPNLIFISSNTFSRTWTGDYPKARPENIYILEDYSKVLCNELEQVINLHQWSPAQVEKFTCDNLHLTKEGSDWIYLRLLEQIGLKERDYFQNRMSIWTPQDNPTPWPIEKTNKVGDISSIKLTQQKPFTPKQIDARRREVGLVNEPLAILVVGLRLGDNDESRLTNLKHLVRHLKATYPGAFEILLVEQDKKRKFELTSDFEGCDYRFLYNPNAYNRGWLYNVVAKHWTKSKVIGFLDTDIIPGSNFLDCVIDCHARYDAVSPNRNLYYANPAQTEEFRQTGKYSHFKVKAENIKNPTTLAGGMLIINRDAFLEIGGFEQYVGYGCEDRALDVTMLALLPSERVRMDSQAYFHQYHPIVESERAYFSDIYNHMAKYYGCEYSPGLAPTDYIHKNCNHADRAQVRKMRDVRFDHIGDLDLYSKNGKITVNGLPGSLNTGFKLVTVEKSEAVFPPEFDGVKPYNDSEELTGRFANAWAPAVKKEEAVDDTRQLQFFYNRFKGKRCFIIGNGPSLNKHDMSLLKNEYTFAVNSFYYKTRETGFMPTFFVVEDSSVIKENKDEIVEFDAPFKFFPSIYQSLHPKKPGTYFFPLNRGFYDKFSPNYAIPRFSTDISKVAYCGQSVTYVNLQLAYYMGFTEVYLIGMDFNYVIPESHSRNGDVLTSDTDDPNHFHKDYFGKGKTWKDPKLDRVLMNYQMAKLVYECAGRKIYNATVGGHLEEFERVDYNGLFGGMDRRLKQEPLDLERPNEAWSKPKFSQEVAPAAVIAPTTPIAQPAAAPEKNSKEVLTIIASQLLTNPKATIAKLDADKPLAATIKSELSKLPKNDRIASHFERALDFAKSS